MKILEIFNKPNELIRAIDKGNVNRLARHLCNYFLQQAQIQIKSKNYSGNPWFEFHIQDINVLAELNYHHKINEIIKALEALTGSVSFCPKDNPKQLGAFSPIITVLVDLEKNVYNIELHSITINLLKTTEYYTRLDLTELNPLKNQYAYRIFEWLKSLQNIEISTAKVDWLRELTGTAEKKTYDNFSVFQTKILDLAKRDINNLTDYHMSYEPIKTRAKTRPKVTQVQFRFTKKQPLSKSAKEIEKETAEITLEQLLDEPFTIDNKYSELLKKYSEAKIFINNSADFYKATQTIPLTALAKFYQDKNIGKYKDRTNILLWLLKDSKTQPTKARTQEMINHYKELVGMFAANEQTIIKEAENRLGFAAILIRLYKYKHIICDIDLERWL